MNQRDRASTPSSSLTTPRRLVLAILSAILMFVGFGAVPANASYNHLCAGYAGCNSMGYGNAGYESASGTSYWGMVPGHNCVNYTAYRLIKNGIDASYLQGQGNAYQWGGVARAHGVAVDGSPKVGDIAWWDASAGLGSFGHVGYVEQVGSGFFVMSDDNYGGDFHWTKVTTSGLWPTGFIHFGGVTPPPSSVGEGSFVAYRGNVYRIAGGAPLYVGSWAPYGGPQPTTALSDSQWSSLRYFPADGTFVAAQPGGSVFRIAGGAPLYVGSWDTYGGPQPYVNISDDNIRNAGATDAANPWSHLRTFPADGTFVAAQPSGSVFRIAGGAPLYVGSWDTYGGPQPYVNISDDNIRNAGATDAANPWSHLRTFPADGTFVAAQPSGSVFRIAGGAPLYVGSWDTYGGPQPYVNISDDNIRNAGATDAANPWSHLRLVPADGTVLQGLPSAAYWSITRGRRSPTGTSPTAVAVEDTAINNIPLVLALTKILPAARGQNSALQLLTLTGSGFTAGTVVSMAGTGINIGSPTVVNSTTITVSISVIAAAASGPRGVRASSPDGATATCTACFSVTQAPAVSGLSTLSLRRGTTKTVTITGSAFAPGMKVAFSGSGLTVKSMTYVSSTKYTIVVTTTAAAATGKHNLTTTNVDGGRGTKASAVTISS